MWFVWNTQKLLEYEKKASEQVPLYIEINNPELALRKAMESGDSDLSKFLMKERCFNNNHHNNNNNLFISLHGSFLVQNQIQQSIWLYERYKQTISTSI